MSRIWNIQDEQYIYKENIKIKKEEIEVLINRINSNTTHEIHLTNIMNVYETKISEYVEYLKNNKIDFYSPSYAKNHIYNMLDKYINQAIKELTKINNKLINEKYDSIVNTKLMLLIININIAKYNSIIRDLKEFKLMKIY